MKAIINKNDCQGNVAGNRKENRFTDQWTVIDFAEKHENPYRREAIVARFYQTAARAYCCVWINSNIVHCIGGAYAGGYGYHRQSEALQGALSNAGVFLDANIGGAGESAMREALMAVAAALGLKDPLIFEAHA